MSTRLSTEERRIEAAAKAMFYAWVEAAHPALRTVDRCDEWMHEATMLAPIALAAADAISESSARRALRDLTDAQEWFDSREHAGECFGHHVHPAKLCVGCESAFERLLVKRAAARAVLSENPIGETT